MRSLLYSIKKYVDRIVDSLQVVMFLVVLAVVIAQILCRYLLNSPLSWSEQLSRFLFIWISLVGWSQAMRSGNNIRITLIEQRLPAVLRLPLNILFKLAVAAYLCLLIYLGAEMVGRGWNRPLVAVSWLTAGMTYLALPIGAAFCLFYTLLDIVVPGRCEEPAVMD